MNKFIIEILDIILRSVISLLVMFAIAKLMGKKHIAQLTFFDYIIGISIGSIAAAFAVDNTINYAHGVTSLIVYGLFAMLLSYITLKSIKAREIISGTPTILVQNGKIIEENLKKSKFHINDVLEACRVKGAYNIADVEFAILETSGQVSIQLKSSKVPLTPEDMKIPTDYKGLVADLILDGVIMHKHLHQVNLDARWLITELAKRGIYNPSDVFLATLDTQGNLRIDMKNSDPKPLDIIE